MHTVVLSGTKKIRIFLKMTMEMTDQQIETLIEIVYDAMDDFVEEGCDLITVASVVLAIVLKRLKITLDEDHFRAILEDISDYHLHMSDDENEFAIRQYSVNKRTLH